MKTPELSLPGISEVKSETQQIEHTKKHRYIYQEVKNTHPKRQAFWYSLENELRHFHQSASARNQNEFLTKELYRQY